MRLEGSRDSPVCSCKSIMNVQCETMAARDSPEKSEILSGQKEPPPSATYAPHGLARDRTSDSVVSSHCTASRLLLSTSPAHTLRQQPQFASNRMLYGHRYWPGLVAAVNIMHVAVTSVFEARVVSSVLCLNTIVFVCPCSVLSTVFKHSCVCLSVRVVSSVLYKLRHTL